MSQEPIRDLKAIKDILEGLKKNTKLLPIVRLWNYYEDFVHKKLHSSPYHINVVLNTFNFYHCFEMTPIENHQIDPIYFKSKLKKVYRIIYVKYDQPVNQIKVGELIADSTNKEEFESQEYELGAFILNSFNKVDPFLNEEQWSRLNNVNDAASKEGNLSLSSNHPLVNFLNEDYRSGILGKTYVERKYCRELTNMEANPLENTLISIGLDTYEVIKQAYFGDENMDCEIPLYDIEKVLDPSQYVQDLKDELDVFKLEYSKTPQKSVLVDDPDDEIQKIHSPLSQYKPRLSSPPSLSEEEQPDIIPELVDELEKEEEEKKREQERLEKEEQERKQIEEKERRDKEEKERKEKEEQERLEREKEEQERREEQERLEKEEKERRDKEEQLRKEKEEQERLEREKEEQERREEQERLDNEDKERKEKEEQERREEKEEQERREEKLRKEKEEQERRDKEERDRKENEKIEKEERERREREEEEEEEKRKEENEKIEKMIKEAREALRKYEEERKRREAEEEKERNKDKELEPIIIEEVTEVITFTTMTSPLDSFSSGTMKIVLNNIRDNYGLYECTLGIGSNKGGILTNEIFFPHIKVMKIAENKNSITSMDKYVLSFKDITKRRYTIVDGNDNLRSDMIPSSGTISYIIKDGYGNIKKAISGLVFVITTSPLSPQYEYKLDIGRDITIFITKEERSDLYKMKLILINI